MNVVFVVAGHILILLPLTKYKIEQFSWKTTMPFVAHSETAVSHPNVVEVWWESNISVEGQLDGDSDSCHDILGCGPLRHAEQNPQLEGAFDLF